MRRWEAFNDPGQGCYLAFDWIRDQQEVQLAIGKGQAATESLGEPGGAGAAVDQQVVTRGGLDQYCVAGKQVGIRVQQG